MNHLTQQDARGIRGVYPTMMLQFGWMKPGDVAPVIDAAAVAQALGHGP